MFVGLVTVGSWRIISAQSTLISVPNVRSAVSNAESKHLYSTTEDPFVRPHNITSGQLETGYNLSGSLAGIDISPDDSFLPAAQNKSVNGTPAIHQHCTDKLPPTNNRSIV